MAVVTVKWCMREDNNMGIIEIDMIHDESNGSSGNLGRSALPMPRCVVNPKYSVLRTP